jgi:hypothetical protein
MMLLSCPVSPTQQWSDAMQETLLAMLILASSWTQEQADDGLPAELPQAKQVFSVNRDFGGKVMQVTFELTNPAAGIKVIDLTGAMVAQENFDRRVFGDRETKRERWNHLEDLLFSKIQAADKKHRLTGPQRAKLQLAGRGDIKRFFDRVEDGRAEFELNRVGFKNGIAALQRLKPLSDAYDRGPFDDGSLFVKTLHKINEDQSARN